MNKGNWYWIFTWPNLYLKSYFHFFFFLFVKGDYYKITRRVGVCVCMLLYNKSAHHIKWFWRQKQNFMLVTRYIPSLKILIKFSNNGKKMIEANYEERGIGWFDFPTFKSTASGMCTLQKLNFLHHYFFVSVHFWI